jgi:anti-sigma28 factor (negative regulator of flagellin synthesis)
MSAVLGERRRKSSNPSRVEELKKKINNEEYLNGAIQRIAQVLSNELLGIPQGGAYDERQWEGR